MEVFRINDKLVSSQKLAAFTDKVLALRALGLSQQETARRLGIDRTLVSRLESLGEIHKGERIAVLGFPVANKAELTAALKKEGVEYIFLLGEQERWDFVSSLSGPALLDRLIGLVAEIRAFDVVILLGSAQRTKSLRPLFQQEVIEVPIGRSPIREDKEVPVGELLELVRLVKNKSQKNKEVNP